MNKGERKDIEQKKWKKRLKNLGIDWSERHKYTCYKKQGKPCSCIVCTPYKSRYQEDHKDLKRKA